MRLRMLLPFAVAALLGVAIVVIPALAAASSEAKLEVNNNCNGYSDWPCWTPPGGSPTYTPSTTIAAGASVDFSDETGVAANIRWTSTPGAAPTCSSEVPVSPTAAKTSWQGECEFAQPGTYRFESSTLYSTYRQYEVVVEGATTTTGAGTGTATGTSSNPSPTSTEAPGNGPGSPSLAAAPGGGANPAGALFAGSSSSACKLPSTQRGRTVHGSVEVSQAAAGGRLEVQLFAASASLASAGHAARVRVGRLVRSSVRAGTYRFTVSLDARATHALHARGHLALTVGVLLSSAQGSTATLTRSVTLRS